MPPVCCLLQSLRAIVGVMCSEGGQVLTAAAFARAADVSAEGHHVLMAAAVAAAAWYRVCTADVLLQERCEHFLGQL